MKNTVIVIGSLWGDEGKGKITNYLSGKADMVVRYQGGDNAGHTICIDGVTYKLHLVPSGIFDPEVKNILANGMVINPRNLRNEILDLKKQGITCENLYIGERAQVIFDSHLILDGLHEKGLGKGKIGTTGKGIGPAYEDKVARKGIRMIDFVSPSFREIYRVFVEKHNEDIVRLGGTPVDFEKSLKEYQEIAAYLKPHIVDSITLINDAIIENQKVVFEGAQGALLDIDFGTYPFVTSSNPTIGGALIGSGIAANRVGEVVGIVKSYSTRVGAGPFPTEMLDKLGDEIRERGHEYGTTTKRPRRIGWFDAVALNYSVMINGITGIALMLLDVLTGIPVIKIATSYSLDGKTIHTIPAQQELCERCKPNYIEMPGWTEDITNCRTYEELPKNAKDYIKKIEECTGVPVVFVSVGPDRDATIVRKQLFADNK